MALKTGCDIPDALSHTLLEPAVFLNGSPLLVYFWAMSCPACKTNMANLHELRDKYADQGLQLIAVHMPRGPFDLNEDKVREAMREVGMSELCLFDNDHVIGNAFETGGVWPVYFLFGANGKLKRHAAGSFGVKMMEAALLRLFSEPDASL